MNVALGREILLNHRVLVMHLKNLASKAQNADEICKHLLSLSVAICAIDSQPERPAACVTCVGPRSLIDSRLISAQSQKR